MNDLANKIVKNDQSFLEYAITELNKINNYRAPRDKIICILNACKIIFSYLKLSKQETNADSFIPILILVIFKAKTDHLISNIHYIENFRGQEWLLHGETSYYLSSIQGAVEFIQNITAEDLTISQAEFDASYGSLGSPEETESATIEISTTNSNNTYNTDRWYW